jgi:hypothetical protein
MKRWPDVVLMVKRPMPEYGYRGFGIDYAIDLFAWVIENYEPATNREAGLVLLRRRKADTFPGRRATVGPSPNPESGLEGCTALGSPIFRKGK